MSSIITGIPFYAEGEQTKHSSFPYKLHNQLRTASQRERSRLPVRKEQKAFSTALVVTELLSDGYLRYGTLFFSHTIRSTQHNDQQLGIPTLRRHHRQQQSNKKSALNKNIFYADYYRSLGLVSVVYKAKSVNRSVEPRWVAFRLVNATSQVVRRRSK